MEKITDCGIICNVFEHGGSSCVVTVFSQTHGMLSGYIKGGLSKHRKHICTIGNHVEFIWTARVVSQLGYIEIALLENFSTCFGLLESSIVRCVCEILTSVMRKSDPHPTVYTDTLALFLGIKNHQLNTNLLYHYTMFENSLLKEIGFGYNFEECNISSEKLSTNKPSYISPKTGNVVSQEIATGYENRLFIVPKFILENNQNPSIIELQNMLDINLHFWKYHLEVQNLVVRSFMINLFKKI